MPDRNRDPAVLGPALAAAAAFVLHAACAGRHGVFRDELYFVACGQRLAAGYVDQPPLIAVVARAAHALFGTWVPGLRLLPWLASAAAVWLAGRLAVRLGGGPFAATLASIAVAASPVLAVLGHYLTMNAFEPLFWLGLATVLARAADGGDPRLVTAAGALAGLAALNKYSAALFALCLAAGLLASPSRRLLLGRPALLGVAAALLAVLPNLAWQIRHGLPFLELVRNGQLAKNAPFTLAGFASSQLVEGGPLVAPVWLLGLGWLLLARAARPWRFLGIGAALLFALLAATRAKGYYFAPALAVLAAAGGVAVEQVLRAAWLRASAAALVAASGLAAAALFLPLFPPDARVGLMRAVGFESRPLERHAPSALPQVDADQFGWDELARAVAAAYRSLPPEEQAVAVVFGQNYGEAAAIDFYGPGLGLPPAVSGHNSYFLWGVPPGRGRVMIVISGEREGCGEGFFRRRDLALRAPENPWAMPYERGRWIWICRDPAGPVEQLWPRVKAYI